MNHFSALLVGVTFRNDFCANLQTLCMKKTDVIKGLTHSIALQEELEYFTDAQIAHVIEDKVKLEQTTHMKVELLEVKKLSSDSIHYSFGVSFNVMEKN